MMRPIVRERDRANRVVLEDEQLVGEEEEIGMGQDPAVNPPPMSIIVPVWNRAGTIRRCLDSILSQSFQDYEIVAVDDGSVDDSVRIMEEYKDSRLRIVRHPENLGKNAARRTGADRAAGRWVLQLDSDDELLAGALERIAAMTHDAPPAVGIVGMSFVYDDGGRSPAPPFPPGDIGFEGWLRWLDGATNGDMLICRRREVYESVPVPADGRGSGQMMMRTAAQWKFRVSSDVGARVHSDADNRLCLHKPLLLSQEAKKAHAVMCCEVLDEFGPALKLYAPRTYVRTFFAAGRWYFLAGDRMKGTWWSLRFLARRPWSLRGWGFLALGLLGPGTILGVRRVFRRGQGRAARPTEAS